MLWFAIEILLYSRIGILRMGVIRMSRHLCRRHGRFPWRNGWKSVIDMDAIRWAEHRGARKIVAQGYNHNSNQALKLYLHILIMF